MKMPLIIQYSDVIIQDRGEGPGALMNKKSKVYNVLLVYIFYV